MSLIGDLLDAVRTPAPRSETLPPVPYTGRYGGFSLGSRSADPNERQIDLTTAESTLYSVLELISGDVGGTRFELYRGPRQEDGRAPDGMAPLTDRQSLAVKLWNKPNDFMTGEHMRTVMAWHYDSVGEAWCVVDFIRPSMPLAFWPVRPDRMKPVTDPDKYLTGYVYTGPSGERIPLELNEVLRITRPHPLDPHRGIGPVPALMLPLTTSLTSQQWIEAFFRNDATPGGILQLEQDQLLEDDDYSTFVKRWNEQHQGVNRAHRIGILEIGSYVPTPVNFKDLQVTEMRHLTRDQVLEAYQLNKFMIGATDDVNRAANLAAEGNYARRVLKRRVRKWDDFANGPYLECFGTAGTNVHWCPENVVPDDEEVENAERDSIAGAFKQYADAGVPLDQISAMLDLPFEIGPQGASPTEIALIAQKLYLSVGKLGQPNVIFSTEEARRLIEAAGGGAFLDDWTPPIVIEQDPMPTPFPPAPPPQQLPPATGEDDLGDDDEE